MKVRAHWPWDLDVAGRFPLGLSIVPCLTFVRHSLDESGESTIRYRVLAPSTVRHGPEGSIEVGESRPPVRSGQENRELLA